MTPAIHAVISGLTSVLSGWEICFSNFGEITTTSSMQLRMDLEAMESELIPEPTQASDDAALLHLGEQPTTPIAQAMLRATVVECIPFSATVSNDGACNNQCVIHDEGTTDTALQVPPNPGMAISNPRIIYYATLAGACGQRYFKSHLCTPSRLC